MELEVHMQQLKELLQEFKIFYIKQLFNQCETKLSEIQKEVDSEEIKIIELLKDISLEDRLEWIDYHKQKGKICFSKDQKIEAFWQFYISLLGIDDVKKLKEYGPDLITNCTLIALKNQFFDIVRSGSEFVLTIDSNNVKSLYRLGQYYETSNVDKAKQYYKKGQEINGLYNKECDFTNALEKLKNVTLRNQ